MATVATREHLLSQRVMGGIVGGVVGGLVCER